jgi:hypothetical protein
MYWGMKKMGRIDGRLAEIFAWVGFFCCWGMGRQGHFNCVLGNIPE